MNKFIVLLSLFLFVFAPVISGQNSNNLTSTIDAIHCSQYCEHTINCTKAYQSCVSHTFMFFTVEEPTNMTRVGFSKRSAYIEHNQPILAGVKTVFYRPPIS